MSLGLDGFWAYNGLFSPFVLCTSCNKLQHPQQKKVLDVFCRTIGRRIYFLLLRILSSTMLMKLCAQGTRIYCPKTPRSGASNFRVLVTAANNPPQRSYEVVVAATRKMGIGKDGKLPWRLPSDVEFFKKLTVTTSDPKKKNAVVMGRKTWDSIPLNFRPLPCRLNVVLSRSGCASDVENSEGAVVCRSIPSALRLLAEETYRLCVEKVFIIGGGQVLRETLNGCGCYAIHITEIETCFDCDTFIPTVDSSVFCLSHSSSPVVENGVRYRFVTYVRPLKFEKTDG